MRKLPTGALLEITGHPPRELRSLATVFAVSCFNALAMVARHAHVSGLGLQIPDRLRGSRGIATCYERTVGRLDLTPVVVRISERIISAICSGVIRLEVAPRGIPHGDIA